MTYKLTVRDLTHCALFTVLLAVSSWISVPAPVPFTLQTFAVFAAILTLGARLGTLSIAAWILLGAAGAPVFSNFTGGLGVLLGASGGYILGFLPAALICRAGEKLQSRMRAAFVLSLAAALIAIYAVGTAWFMYIYAGGSGASLAAALGTCVVPFIIPDIVKILLAYALSSTLRRHIRR